MLVTLRPNRWSHDASCHLQVTLRLDDCKSPWLTDIKSSFLSSGCLVIRCYVIDSWGFLVGNKLRRQPPIISTSHDVTRTRQCWRRFYPVCVQTSWFIRLCSPSSVFNVSVWLLSSFLIQLQLDWTRCWFAGVVSVWHCGPNQNSPQKVPRSCMVPGLIPFLTFLSVTRPFVFLMSSTKQRRIYIFIHSFM